MVQLLSWQFPGVDIVETLKMPMFDDFTFEGKTVFEMLSDFGFGGITGRFSIVSDPRVLDQVDTSKFKANGIVTTPAFKMDELNSGMLDRH